MGGTRWDGFLEMKRAALATFCFAKVLNRPYDCSYDVSTEVS